MTLEEFQNTIFGAGETRSQSEIIDALLKENNKLKVLLKEAADVIEEANEIIFDLLDEEDDYESNVNFVSQIRNLLKE